MADNRKEDDDSAPDRLADVYRQWTAARRQIPWRDWWEKQMRFGDVGLVVAFFATVFLIFVDFALHDSLPPELASLPRGIWWAGPLILLFLGNTVLLGRVLQRRALRALPVGWRIGTAVACSVPFLGLYAFIAAARRMSGSVQEEPLSLRNPSGSHLCFRLHSLGDRWARVIVREGGAKYYYVTNLLVLLWISLTLPGRTWSTIGLSVVLHAAAASGLVLHALAVVRTTRAGLVPLARLLAPASLTLFMVPLIPFFGFVFYSIFTIPWAPQRALMRTLQQNRSSTNRLPRWLELRDSLRRARRSGLRERRSNSPVPGEIRELTDTDRYLLWTYILKSSSLVPDGAALSWLAFWATAGFSFQRGIVEALITGIAGVSLALGGVGLSLMLLRTFRHRVGAEGRFGLLDRHPVRRYLAASQLSLATGLFLGGPLFEEDGREVGIVVALAALCGAAVLFPRLLFSTPGREDRTVAVGGPWAAFFAIFAILGFEWANGHESTAAMLWLFRVCLVFFPFAVPLFIYRQLLIRLLRPFGLRDLLDPEWSPYLRRSLRFLTVTALLPLGGLAVPAWIWTRYRYWPDFEREWHERVSRSRGDGGGETDENDHQLV